MTHKPEAILRDELAWSLQESQTDKFVAREWCPGKGLGRTDLAILRRSADGLVLEPDLLVELKVYSVFDHIYGLPKHHRKDMHGDMQKLRNALAHLDGASGIFLIADSFVMTSIPSYLTSVIKYAPLIDSGVKLANVTDGGMERVRRDAREQVQRFLTDECGVECDSHWLVLGPHTFWDLEVGFDALAVVVT